ncbi:MAG: UDP-N-acetylglucosamine 1-carboxyvinyltransferase [Clostridia bacterium]|nr:UDP-N-acetylglucosamine 1-carboxyvinyltransferase [Clostridia bacterium]
MSVLRINGGRPLAGRISVHGAKNSVLPILAATLIHPGEMTIHNCPDLRDVRSAIKILTALGAKIKREKDKIVVDAGTINCCNIADDLMREMRSSVIFLGAMLSRCKSAVISYPGGCELGPRPIDLHLSALKKLGISITEENGKIYCSVENLSGADIHLPFPSVGATENIMIAAMFAKGRTRITNPAREPEIEDLQNFLCAMGGKITGAGGHVIEIEGVSKTFDCEHKVIPDRIVAATYLTAVAVSGGDVLIENVEPSQMNVMCEKLSRSGCLLYQGENYIRIIRKNPLYSMGEIKTEPYPGFPTDAQALFAVLATQCDGQTVVRENIFENRYQYVPELVKMGADIKTCGRVAVINGGNCLNGAAVKAPDLRGGAALIVAALGAQGESIISELSHIDRGYENIEGCLSSIGAQIVREV